MANPIDLTSQPKFVAEDIVVDRRRCMVVGIENKLGDCSYYTVMTIIGEKIEVGSIDELKEALAEELEKSKAE